MRKYASKLLLDIFLSVVATVTVAYVGQHYSPASSARLAPVLAETTGASKSAASVFASASAPEHVAASKIPSDVVNSAAAATTVADRAAEADQDEKAGLSPPAKYLKPALPASHRSAPRDKKAH
jgi:hypothetical protein